SMKKITIRDVMYPADLVLFSHWVYAAADINCFVDPDLILNYQRAIMLCADDDDGPILYLPVQSVQMVRDPLDLDSALARAAEMQQREVYCLTQHADDVPLDWEQLVNFRILRKAVTPVIQAKPASVLMLE